MAGQKKKEPVKRLKAWTGSGLVEVSIWQNENADFTNYSTTIQRSYKKDDQWETSSSFFPQGILVASRLLEQAWDVIQELQAKNR